MEALYGVLGMLFGIALAEAVHWRTGRTGVRRRVVDIRRDAAGPSADSRARRFTARDYYDR